MKKIALWQDRYKGIGVEIANWQLDDKDCWAAYVLLYKAQAPQLWLSVDNYVKDKYAVYRVAEHPVWGATSTNGGWTWFEQVVADGIHHHIKAGYDYQHLWNEGRVYTSDVVLSDLKRTVDDLHRLTDIKVPCVAVGGWHDLSAMIETRNGYLSDAGVQFYKEQGWEIPA